MSTSISEPKIKAIIADWDDTITAEDTIKLLAECAYETKPNFSYPWSYFSNIYTDSYNEFTSKYGSHGTVEEEIEFQKGMKAVEMSSVNKIMELELFKGVTIENIKQKSNKVKIKNGFWQFLKMAKIDKIPIIILSVNWTSYIIRETLNKKGFFEGEYLKIIVNELEFDSSGVCTGYIHKGGYGDIRTGYDKLSITKEIIEENDLKSSDGQILYIGDSSTDVLSMIESDLSIIIEGGSATKSLDRLGFRVASLRDGVTEDKFYRVKDWNDIIFLL